MPELRDRYAPLLVRMWDDPDWVACSPRAQWFYMLLLSQPKLNKAGVISLTINWWSKLAAGGGVQQVESALAELEQHGFIVVDRDTEELLVRTYIRNSGVAKQPNVLKRALREAREVNSRTIRVALAAELNRLDLDIAREAAGDLHPHPSPGKANANPSGNPSAKGSPKGSTPSRGDKPDTSRSQAQPEGFAEPLTEGFAEGFAKPRGTGLGLGSSSSVDINVSSQTSSSDDASRRRPDVDQLCGLLRDRVLANGSKASITEKWRREARLLLDRDQRPLEEALWLIDWCQNDAFWNTNILSMPTFRKHYDRLRMQSRRSNLAPSRTSTTPGNVTELATSDQRFQRGMRIAAERRARRLAAEGNQPQPPALRGAAS